MRTSSELKYQYTVRLAWKGNTASVNVSSAVPLSANEIRMQALLFLNKLGYIDDRDEPEITATIRKR